MQKTLLQTEKIETIIYTIRGFQVMMDRDLAQLYNVETRMLNQAVKRNISRFPETFCFRLNDAEFKSWISQIVISKSKKMGLRKPPIVFTEQGVAMLSSVLHSVTAINVSIQIMNAFVSMRKKMVLMGNLEYRVEKIEHKLSEVDSSFEKLFNALENKNELAAQGIFFEGQIFDAFHFVSKIIRSARSSIILIDNYVNDDTLLLFSKANKGVLITIYTQKITDQLKQAIMKFNKQFGNLTIQNIPIFHDRFLLIDQKELYHIGSSLKDLGNKIFGFSKMNPQIYKLLAKLNDSENY